MVYRLRTFQEYRTIFNIKHQLDGFNFSSNDSLALFLLLNQCKNELMEIEEYPLPIDFIIDKRNPRNTDYKDTILLQGIASESRLCYKDSKKDILLQIADFVAYSINRVQMIIVKEKKSYFDECSLEIMSDFFENANLNGITKKVRLDKVDVNLYDKIIRKDKNKKGLMSDKEYNIYIQRLKESEHIK